MQYFPKTKGILQLSLAKYNLKKNKVPPHEDMNQLLVQPAKTAGLFWINMSAYPGLLHEKQSKPLIAWTSAYLHLQAQPENHTLGARKAAVSSYPCIELGKKNHS